MTKDNIIQFPGKPFDKKKIITDKKEVQKISKEIEEQQTREFVEACVDDVALHLIRFFYDLKIQVNSPQFTRDFAMVIDTIRGLVYRDFGTKHPSQKLVDEIVSLFSSKTRGPSAKIDYKRILKNVKDQKKEAFSKTLKKDLKEIDENDGVGFDPDFDV